VVWTEIGYNGRTIEVQEDRVMQKRVYGLFILGLPPFVLGVIFLLSSDSEKEHLDVPPKERDYMPGLDVPALLNMVDDSQLDIEIRRAAVLQLGKSGDRRAVDQLLNYIRVDWNPLTEECIVALGRIGDPKAVPFLEDLRKKKGSLTGSAAVAITRAIRACKGEGRELHCPYRVGSD
jgi:hypothetical protein